MSIRWMGLVMGFAACGGARESSPVSVPSEMQPAAPEMGRQDGPTWLTEATPFEQGSMQPVSNMLTVSSTAPFTDDHIEAMLTVPADQVWWGDGNTAEHIASGHLVWNTIGVSPTMLRLGDTELAYPAAVSLGDSPMIRPLYEALIARSEHRRQLPVDRAQEHPPAYVRIAPQTTWEMLLRVAYTAGQAQHPATCFVGDVVDGQVPTLCVGLPRLGGPDAPGTAGLIATYGGGFAYQPSAGDAVAVACDGDDCAQPDWSAVVEQVGSSQAVAFASEDSTMPASRVLAVLDGLVQHTEAEVLVAPRDLLGGMRPVDLLLPPSGSIILGGAEPAEGLGGLGTRGHTPPTDALPNEE